MNTLVLPPSDSSRRTIISWKSCTPSFAFRFRLPVTVRALSELPTSIPAAEIIDSTSRSRLTEKSPSIKARSAPDLSRSEEKRPPSSTPSASTMIDFPEPVSPVSRLSPRSNSTCRLSINAIFEMFNKASIVQILKPAKHQEPGALLIVQQKWKSRRQEQAQEAGQKGRSNAAPRLILITPSTCGPEAYSDSRNHPSRKNRSRLD